MTAPEVNLTRILSTTDSWKSLLSDERRQPDVIAEVFQVYKQRLVDPDLSSNIDIDEETFYNSMMEDTVADTIMKYMIFASSESSSVTTDIEAVRKLTDFLYLIPNGDAIFFEIQDIFDQNLPFDPYWKLTQTVAEYEISRKEIRDPLLKDIEKEQRGGFLKCWDKYPLTRYRITHRLRSQRVKTRPQKAKYSTLKAKRKESQLALEILNPNSAKFQKGPYFFTLLKHHDLLIAKVPVITSLFFRQVEPQAEAPPKSYTDPISRRSLKGNETKRTESASDLRPTKSRISRSKLLESLLDEENSDILERLNSLRNDILPEACFPNISKLVEESIVASEPIKITVDILEKSTISDDEMLRYVKLFMHQIASSNFSYAQMNELLNLLLEDIREHHKHSPHSWIKEIAALSIIFFKLPLKEQISQSFAKALAKPLKEILDDIHSHHRKKPKTCVEKLSNLAHTFFKMSPDITFYRLLLDVIAPALNMAKEKEIAKLKKYFDKKWIEARTAKKKEMVLNIWDELFEKKSDKMMDVIIHELNSETARLFRMFDLKELNSEIPKFLKQTPALDVTMSGIEGDVEDIASFRMQNLFNKLSFFISYRILISEDIEEMCKIIGVCIELVERMLTKTVLNLHVILAIHSGIQSLPITRLESLYLPQLSRKHRNGLDRLKELLDYKENYKNLRRASDEWQYPSIPYVGMLKGEFEYVCQKWDEDREIVDQNNTIADMVEKFLKTQTLLRATVPVKGLGTGAEQSIYGWFETIKLSRDHPLKKQLKTRKIDKLSKTDVNKTEVAELTQIREDALNEQLLKYLLSLSYIKLKPVDMNLSDST